MRGDSDDLQRLVAMLGQQEKELLSIVQAPQIPVSVFRKPHTILQALSKYLHDQGKSEKDISTLTGRTLSAIHNALRAAQQKPELDTSETFTVSPHIFRKALSPAECLIYHLVDERRVSNATAARMLGRDPRNTHKQLQAARKKLEVKS